MKINLPLLALATGAFGIGVTEFAPMGLLPLIAEDLGVSIPSAGLLVSAYAAGVLIAAPVMTLLTVRLPRRAVLIGLMAIFTLGNLMSALAGSYETLFVARVVTSFNHGAFFGIGSVVAISVVAPEKRASAVAAMFMGLTIATIGGVPLATWAGEQFGWRQSFFGIAAIGLVAMLCLRLGLPPLPSSVVPDIGREVAALKRRPVLVALALTVLGASAMFTVFTYISPILREETQATPLFVTAMLVVYGCGLTAGNWLGGRYADRSLDGTLIVMLAALAVLLVVFALIMPYQAPVAVLIFFWGVASFAIVPPLQMRIMVAAADAPNLASAVNVGAFNLGNALGAVLGGAIIDLGLGYPAVALGGAATAASALAVALLARRQEAKSGAETAACRC